MHVSSSSPIRCACKLPAILTALLIAACLSAAVRAETSSSDPLAPTKSMGQPPPLESLRRLLF
jgi:hypothetical protein